MVLASRDIAPDVMYAMLPVDGRLGTHDSRKECSFSLLHFVSYAFPNKDGG